MSDFYLFIIPCSLFNIQSNFAISAITAYINVIQNIPFAVSYFLVFTYKVKMAMFTTKQGMVNAETKELLLRNASIYSVKEKVG